MKTIAKRIDWQCDHKIITRMQFISHRNNPKYFVTGKCFTNALKVCDILPDAKIVAGWLVAPCDAHSLRPEYDAMIIKHYWNRYRGQHIDATPMNRHGVTWVWNRDHAVDYTYSTWLLEDDFKYWHHQWGTDTLTHHESTQIQHEKQHMEKITATEFAAGGTHCQ